jgi:hypothetical protein
MLTRRIATTLCALCFAAPAAAGASPAQDAPVGGSAPTVHATTKAKGPYGIAPATALQDTTKAKGPYGIAPATGPQDTTKAKGTYGIAPATGPQDTTKAKGPYGIAPATGPAHATVASHGGDTNDWRTAALSEGALLAAFALGSALLLQTRRSAPRMGT